MSRPSGRTAGGPKLGWWRKYFLDHPLKDAKHSSAFASSGGARKPDKYKVVCKACLKKALEDAKTADPHLDEAAFMEQLWAAQKTTTNDVLWLSSAKPTLINHLLRCKNDISREVRELAAVEKKKAGGDDREDDGLAAHAGPSYGNSAIDPTLSNLPFYPQAGRPLAMHVSSTGVTMPGLQRSLSLPADFQGTAAATAYVVADPSASPSPIPLPVHQLPPPSSSGSTTPSHTPSPSPIVTPYLLGQTPSPSYPSALGHGPRRAARRVPSVLQRDVPWTEQRQDLFESFIARLTVSANLPHSWIENNEWIVLVKEFIPDAKLFKRKKLTNTLIPQELEKRRAAAKSGLKETNAREGTLQLDGWTANNYHHFLGFMLTAAAKAYAVRLKDTSCERKTAAELLSHVRTELTRTEADWGVKIIALVSDNSGESLAMRRALRLEQPDLIVLQCYAHQINLIVGDYLKKCGAKFLDASAEADQVIKWIRSKTFVLALLRTIQEEQGIPCPLTVIRAVITRWTSHYLAYRRLLDLKDCIVQVVVQDRLRQQSGKESQLVTGNAEAKAKAREVLAIIDKPLFWHQLARIKVHLTPLALAANILQSTWCRLDLVSLTFGTLYLRFQRLAQDDDADADEDEVCRVVCDSLNKRWLDSDQDVLIAAVILNPRTKATPLKNFRTADILALLMRVWKRLFCSQTVPSQFYNEVNEYLMETGNYRDISDHSANLHNSEDPDLPASPLQIWKLFMLPDVSQTSPLQQLAERLFSVCPNAAPVERLFSLLKRIMTPARSRLTGTNLMNTAELNMHIIHGYESNGSLAARYKRREHHFIDFKEQSAGVTSTPRVASPLESSATPRSLNATSSRELAAVAVHASTLPGEVAREELPSSGPEAPLHEPRPSMQDIARSMAEQSAESHAGTEYGPTERPDRSLHCSLADIFNFNNTYWYDTMDNLSLRSLNDEMEAHNLFDMDAEGEDDFGDLDAL